MMEVQQQGPASGDVRPVGERVTKKNRVGAFFLVAKKLRPYPFEIFGDTLRRFLLAISMPFV